MAAEVKLPGLAADCERMRCPDCLDWRPAGADRQTAASPEVGGKCVLSREARAFPVAA